MSDPIDQAALDKYILHRLPGLAQRFSRAIETGRTMQLSAEEVDILCLIGVYEVIAIKAAEELQKEVRRRVAARIAAAENL